MAEEPKWSDNPSVRALQTIDWKDATIKELEATNADLLAALDHNCLRELFGEIEDSGTPEAARLWSLCLQWFDVRNAALAKAKKE